MILDIELNAFTLTGPGMKQRFDNQIDEIVVSEDLEIHVDKDNTIWFSNK